MLTFGYPEQPAANCTLYCAMFYCAGVDGVPLLLHEGLWLLLQKGSLSQKKKKENLDLILFSHFFFVVQDFLWFSFTHFSSVPKCWQRKTDHKSK